MYIQFSTLFTITHRRVQVTLLMTVVLYGVIILLRTVFFEDSGLLECDAVLLVELFGQMKRHLFSSARVNGPLPSKMRQHNPLKC
jgi:hypothetical protein